MRDKFGDFAMNRKHVALAAMLGAVAAGTMIGGPVGGMMPVGFTFHWP